MTICRLQEPCGGQTGAARWTAAIYLASKDGFQISDEGCWGDGLMDRCPAAGPSGTPHERP